MCGSDGTWRRQGTGMLGAGCDGSVGRKSTLGCQSGINNCAKEAAASLSGEAVPEDLASVGQSSPGQTCRRTPPGV